MAKQRICFERSQASAAATILIACLLLSSPANCAEDLPRFKLQAGHELSYRLLVPQIEWNNGNGGKITERSTTLQWNIYVVRKNENGARRLFFTNRWSSEGSESFEVYSDGYCELSSDGSLANTATLPLGIQDITLFFPPLPRDAESFASGWQATSPVDGAIRNMKIVDEAAASKKSEFLLREDNDNLLNSILERTERREYLFDLDQGLVRSGTVDVEQRFAKLSGSARMTIELMGVRQLEHEQAAQLDDELDQYVAADQQYRLLIYRAQHQDFKNAETLLDEAESVLRQLAPRLKLPVVAAVVEDKLKSHERNRAYYLRSALEVAGMVNMPAPDWQTTDLDDNPRAMADYRGKVVVLDFWFRGCGWCIRCMPQINELVDDFKGRDVVFLGMNSDENEDDARFVIEKARLDYLTLKDEDQRIRKNFRGPATYPTMIVVDAAGIVRHVHIGYSADLRRDVGKVINELLAGGPRDDPATR